MDAGLQPWNFTQTNGSELNSIEPFRMDIPETEFNQLRSRFASPRWLDAISDAGWACGMPLSYVVEMAECLLNIYDWKHFRNMQPPLMHTMPLLETRGSESSEVPQRGFQNM